MPSVAIGYLTKDKVELSKRTIGPLLKAPVDVYSFDGSTTDEGKHFSTKYKFKNNGRFWGVGGGPDAAVVFALTRMLEAAERYEYIGLCENDVLLAPDWYERTFELFELGYGDGLPVGAVSPRCYVDRMLFQCEGYAVMHNLGWGMQLMTREAAQLTLNRMRTSWTTENRRTFAKLAATDIAKWWAFKDSESWLCADWGNDRMLAEHGLASLALVPSAVQMIGQTPPLHDQGLEIADCRQAKFDNHAQFKQFAQWLTTVRNGEWSLNTNKHGEFHDFANSSWIYFAHQLPSIGGLYTGDWNLRFQQGFGPFAWMAAQQDTNLYPALTLPVIGPVSFIVSGGVNGGQLKATDLNSGYEISPKLSPESTQSQVMHILIPAGITYRYVKLEMLSPGMTLFGIRAREPQPWRPNVRFTHDTLPPVPEPK